MVCFADNSKKGRANRSPLFLSAPAMPNISIHRPTPSPHRMNFFDPTTSFRPGRRKCHPFHPLFWIRLYRSISFVPSSPLSKRYIALNDTKIITTVPHPGGHPVATNRVLHQLKSWSGKQSARISGISKQSAFSLFYNPSSAKNFSPFQSASVCLKWR